jgi:cytochrome c5
MRNKLSVLLLVFFSAACGAGHLAFHPIESDLAKINKPDSQANLNDLKKGFTLYVTNCAGCHWLPVPSTKKKAEWEEVFPEMFAKVQLNQAEQELIRQYVYSKL